MFEDGLLGFGKIGASKQIGQVRFDSGSHVNSSLGFFLELAKHTFHNVIFFGDFRFVVFNFNFAFFVENTRFVVLMLLLTEFHSCVICLFLQKLFIIFHFADFAVLFIKSIIFVH